MRCFASALLELGLSWAWAGLELVRSCLALAGGEPGNEEVKFKVQEMILRDSQARLCRRSLPVPSELVTMKVKGKRERRKEVHISDRDPSFSCSTIQLS